MIKGFINILLDELCDWLDEVLMDKEIYIIC